MTENIYTLDGTEAGYKEFLLSIVSNGGIATALRKKMGADELDALLRDPGNLPALYIISLQMVRTVDNAVAKNGVRTVESFGELQQGGGEYLDIDFRTGIFAKSPQVTPRGVVAVTEQDFKKPEWTEFLLANGAKMVAGVKSVVGGIMAEFHKTHMPIIREEREAGRQVLPEAFSHLLAGGHNVDLGNLCRDFGDPSRIQRDAQLTNLKAAVSQQVVH